MLYGRGFAGAPTHKNAPKVHVRICLHPRLGRQNKLNYGV